MPCLSPVNIVNPTRYYQVGRDKPFLNVPCGKCEGCQVDKKNQWLVRSYFEWKHAQENNGFSLMFLLTYRPSCTPTFSKISKYKCNDMCFNQKDVSRMLESLKRYCKRHGEYVSFIVCSEYAKNPQFSKRPHYHGIINYIGALSPVELRNKIQSLWHYGIVSPYRSTQSMIITNYKGIAYSMKYTIKDMFFYNRDCVNNLMKDDILAKECSHTLPKRHTSYQFGRVIADLVLQQKNPLQFLDDGIRMEFDEVLHSMPRYIINKLCYTYTPDGFTDSGNKRYKRSLNQFGLEFKRYQSKMLIQRLEEDMMVKFSPAFLFGRWRHINYWLAEHDFNCDCHTFLKSVTKNIDLYKLAQYKVMFQGKKIPPYTFELSSQYKVLHNTDISLFENYFFDTLDTPKILNSHGYTFNKDSHAYFNDCDIFQGYDECLYVYNFLRSCNDEGKVEYNVLQEKQVQKIKDYLEYVSS